MRNESHRRSNSRKEEREARYVSEVLPLDLWTVSPEYLEDLYGSEVAAEYVKERDEERQLSDEELLSKIARELQEILPKEA